MFSRRRATKTTTSSNYQCASHRTTRTIRRAPTFHVCSCSSRRSTVSALCCKAEVSRSNSRQARSSLAPLAACDDDDCILHVRCDTFTSRFGNFPFCHRGPLVSTSCFKKYTEKLLKKTSAVGGPLTSSGTNRTSIRHPGCEWHHCKRDWQRQPKQLLPPIYGTSGWSPTQYITPVVGIVLFMDSKCSIAH